MRLLIDGVRPQLPDPDVGREVTPKEAGTLLVSTARALQGFIPRPQPDADEAEPMSLEELAGADA
ncbi:hypothetical protein ACWGI9_42375 [Streptomyces sp. NPDC054833]